MQVEIKQLNAVNKEITLVIEAERAMKKYQKYLAKAGKEVAVPGFRKGKAPLNLVERMYADKVMDLFYKEMVDDCFDEASREHEIHYLLYPEVKDIQWEKDQDMTIVIEIETEPIVEFKQLEGIVVPHTPILLEDEVSKYIEDLRMENSIMIDVEDFVGDADEVECEVSFESNGEKVVLNSVSFDAQTEGALQAFDALKTHKIGEIINIELSGMELAAIIDDDSLDVETNYSCGFMINSIRRKQTPDLNDEFAKDLEFGSLEEMREKIANDMRLLNEHKNINIKHQALIGKLFMDNQFALPEKTMNHIASRETEKIKEEKWKAFYEYQVRMQIAQEMVNLYVMNNLKRQSDVAVSPEDIENYLNHIAILEDITVEAWKERHKDYFESSDFQESVKNFVVVNQVAEKCDFVIAEPEKDQLIDSAEQDITDAEIIPSTPQAEIQADIFGETPEV